MKTNKTSPKKIVHPVIAVKQAITQVKGVKIDNGKKQEHSKSLSGRAKMIEVGKKNLEKGKWKPGKSGNPKGRKPKSFTMLIEQAKKLGYAQVTKEQLREAFQAMIGMDKDQIFKLANDPKQPWAIHLVATRYLSREGWDMLEDMLDRAHGTPTQSTNLSGEVGFTLAGGLLDLERKKQKPEG